LRATAALRLRDAERMGRINDWVARRGGKEKE